MKSLHEDLAGAMWQRCLYESSSGMLLEFLASRSCKILSSCSSSSFYDDLVSYDPVGFVGFSEGSWHEDLGHGLLQFLARRSCKDPGEIF